LKTQIWQWTDIQSIFRHY